MKVTYFGQSSFLVETKGKRLLFDPFIAHNPLAKGIDVNDIRCDHILLTHGHQDHTADTEDIARNNGAGIVSNFEVVSWYEAKGIKGHPMNLGGKWQFDFGTAKYVNAVHSSAMPDGAYAGNPGGFVIWNDEGCFYHAGDTALTLDMQLIPRTCPPLDFAILPIGDNFTMGYEDAAIAAEFIACDTIIGCHFDTFGFIAIDHDKANAAFAGRGKKLILPNVGEAFYF
jgi:L-ascorbate metabolism protein UlaG (beta-lactamase superfamily)